MIDENIRSPNSEMEQSNGRGSYPIGFVHIDLAELRTKEGKLYLFIAIDRTSKFVFASLVARTTTEAAVAFLDALVTAVPYRIHTILSDNGIQFADLPKHRKGFTARLHGHPFDRACEANGIEHRLTKPNHPWTNDQAERMNRTIKEATVKRYHHDDHQTLIDLLDTFLNAYNFARRLKTLKELAPYEFICQRCKDQPQRFTKNPIQHFPGPSI